ncbi:hypothetical protein QPR60_05830 [Enterobacter hormaechei]|uniref:Uncharacterized protein n=2 Tax=Enterobacter hormaechei TaxID=158836 RepID=A0AAW8Z933_9ENTR|nr:MULTISPECIES: hypothetical protein [Enterobacter]UAS95638.1 hypothetical protein K9O84_05660 [Enterobacter cloacae complex sp.]HAT3923058.1 hypothetical protein [Citrobacter amalonaticus]ELT5715684.1 hypothetical protein [Enterobacter hormaechei]KTI41249.1 hypothetical protein ASV05_24355 [Enterobacter hormaechei subsp. xiangfangensis]KTI47636.1 hypothetical protein ASV03_09545 [Enterobacter hormaechei subsp. steigerwaltii]
MKQKFIEWFTNNNNGCSPAMEDDRSFVREKTQHMFEAYQAGVAEGEARCAALAAENAGLKTAIEKHADSYIMCGYCRTERDGKNDDVCEVLDSTPATDAFLAEVRASAVDEACLKISNAIVNCYQDELVGLDEAATICGDFASEVRKGVQS